jgi:arylsulfatase A-like enzyme
MYDNIKNMGQRFKDLGYKTAYTGKWHLDGHDYFGTGSCAEGWDAEYWYDGRNYLDDLSDEEIAMWRTGLNSIKDLEQNNIRAEFTWAYPTTNPMVHTHALRNMPKCLNITGFLWDLERLIPLKISRAIRLSGRKAVMST